MSAANAPTARLGAWVIPTDDGLIVWGGFGWNSQGAVVDPEFESGAVYHLCNDSWTPISTAGAPSGVTETVGSPVPPGTWTGSGLIVWGGSPEGAIVTEGTPVAVASRYDVASNTWSPMDRYGEPTARQDDARVWTGSQLLVWGGYAQSATQTVDHADGALYDLEADQWIPMSSLNAPSRRDPYGQFVWTGSKFIVWGGLFWETGSAADATFPADGAMYDIASDSWTTLATAGAPSRGLASLLWTGKKMIALAKLDGFTTPGQILFDGELFDPATNSWSPMNPPSLALAANLEDPVAFTPPRKIIWAGSKMVVFGNKIQQSQSGQSVTPAALVYDPETNDWSAVGPSTWPAFVTWQLIGGTPGDLAIHAAGDLLVAGAGPQAADAWGATHDTTAVALLDPASASWTTLPVLSNRTSAAVVVSARRLFAWGGKDIFTDLDAGNRCSGDCVTPTQQRVLGDGLVIAF
jgi:hypothetical protein